MNKENPHLPIADLIKKAQQEAATINLPDRVCEGREQVRGYSFSYSAAEDLSSAYQIYKHEEGWLVDYTLPDIDVLLPDHSYNNMLALRRGKTFTRPQVPLFSRTIRSRLLALMPDTPRPTVTLAIPINQALEIGVPEVKRTFIKNRRFGLAKADTIADNPYDPDHQQLAHALELGELLYKKRRERGELALFDITSGFVSSPQGFLHRLDRFRKFESCLAEKEFIIMANTAATNFFEANNQKGVTNNHIMDDPDDEVRTELLYLYDELLGLRDEERQKEIKNQIYHILRRSKVIISNEELGHYGLKREGYYPVASPLAYYVDVMNQRLILAAAERWESPYTSGQIEARVGHIDRVYQGYMHLLNLEEEDRTNIERYRNVISSGEFNTMPADVYQSLITYYDRNGYLPDSLKDDALKRLQERDLLRTEIAVLLYKGQGDNPNWLEVKGEILRWLDENPQVRKEVMMEVLKAKGVGKITYRYVGGIESGELVIEAQWKTAEGKELTVSHPMNPQDDKENKLDRKIIAETANYPLAFDEETEGKKGRDYMYFLEKLCELNGWITPIITQYEIKGVPVCRVEMKIKTESYIVDMKGSDKVTAMSRAAKKILEKLIDVSTNVNLDPYS